MHEDIPDSFMDGYDVSFCSSHPIWQLGSQIQNISAEKMPFYSYSDRVVTNYMKYTGLLHCAPCGAIFRFLKMKSGGG